MQETILKSFDIWTASQTIKSNGRTISVENQKLLGIDKLRELILDLAVRGKLVPQDEKEESAVLLLKKILTEKQKLSQKDKTLRNNLKEEVERFSIPSSWKWASLNEISQYIQRGKGPIYSDFGKIKVISQKCIQWTGFDITRAKCVDDSSIQEYSADRFLKKDDLLLNSTGTGTVGRINVIGEIEDNRYVADSHVTIIRPLLMNSRFIWCYLASPGVQSRIDPEHELSLVTGTTKQVELTVSSILPLLIPIPPLVEQHRIVAKVDELMALCDQLEQQQTQSNATHQQLVELLLQNLTEADSLEAFEAAWQRITLNFDTLFTTEYSIDHLKQTIPQLAVMGKLVPQDPTDEPASELLKKIVKEKERLVKEGMIKKQEKLPEITEEEKPFELPRGWEWVKFSQIGEINRGKSKHRPRNDKSLYIDGKYPVVQTGDVARANGVVTTYTGLYNEKGLSQSRIWPKGTLCITIAANIADSSILGFDACFPDSIVGFIPSQEIQNTKYFEYFVRTAKNHLIDFAPSTAQKNINLGILETVLIPLPPKNEISRIVAKVDELFALCDVLKERIKEAQETQGMLAEGVVEGVLGHKVY